MTKYQRGGYHSNIHCKIYKTLLRKVAKSKFWMGMLTKYQSEHKPGLFWLSSTKFRLFFLWELFQVRGIIRNIKEVSTLELLKVSMKII